MQTWKNPTKGLDNSDEGSPGSVTRDCGEAVSADGPDGIDVTEVGDDSILREPLEDRISMMEGWLHSSRRVVGSTIVS